MKKKIFFILGSLKAGGAERVFWLISQNIDSQVYDVSLILLNSSKAFYPIDSSTIRVIDLGTVKASRSFPKLFTLLSKEKPDVVFSTGGQINVLVAFIGIFLPRIRLIARPTNQNNTKFLSLKARALSFMLNGLYRRFDKIICQSIEIKEFIQHANGITESKLVVIPNPILRNNVNRKNRRIKDANQLIVVARLTKQKGIPRLLDIVSKLPKNYSLTIVGDGPLEHSLNDQITKLSISDRVKMIGLKTTVLELMSQNAVFVLPSYIEGFPNVVIESLSVGTPVVSFRVGGISEIVTDGFNGYIVDQNNERAFMERVINACERNWNSDAIRADVFDRFGLKKVIKQYEDLI